MHSLEEITEKYTKIIPFIFGAGRIRSRVGNIPNLFSVEKLELVSFHMSWKHTFNLNDSNR